MEIQDKTHTVLFQRVGAILGRKSKALVVIAPDLSVFDAVDLMAANDIGALPVLDQGRVVGMISERDYARKIILEGRSSRGARVAEIMDTSDLSVTPAATLGECMERMVSQRTRHLLVLEGERLAGIVSIGDLVNAVIAAQDSVIGALSDYIGGVYPQ